ncbi:MAG: YbaB/EbfC family nucleoid-associated protein, partial [Desulfovibrio sp.]|nr:YbaB/EbfC family nucleoid-associated protein [Desulfovibrio sp.]
EKMAEQTFKASSGGGMVQVEMNGKHVLTSLKIDPQVLEHPDLEMLQDLIVAAVNEASRIAADSIDREISTLSNGIKLPGFF